MNIGVQSGVDPVESVATSVSNWRVICAGGAIVHDHITACAWGLCILCTLESGWLVIREAGLAAKDTHLTDGSQCVQANLHRVMRACL